MKYAFTVLEDASGVFGKLPAQHPKHPAGLSSPEDVARIAAGGFPAKPPEGFNLKSKGTNTRRKSKKRKVPVASSKKSRKVVRTSNDDDADLAVYFATLDSVPQVPVVDIVFPKFIDPYTKCEITSPAISPYGQVCEYDSWTKVLGTSAVENICPFTGKRLTRSQLVKLSIENIEEFQEKIINQEKALKEWRESHSTEEFDVEEESDSA